MIKPHKRAYWAGAWKTTEVTKGGMAITEKHKTQAEAHAHIGAQGGSMDPEYRGKTGDCVTVGL